MSLFILCPIIIAACWFSSSSDMRHTRFMVTIHGSYTMLLSHTCTYLRLSSVFKHHPGVRIHSSFIPYSSAHLHPYVRLHPQRYILTDGARPKLKGISHLGRIWVCPFLPRHHLPNLDFLTHSPTTLRFTSHLSYHHLCTLTCLNPCWPDGPSCAPPG